ncbi:MAG TPA: DUF1801 domain-containing protein [Micromonosporaceae bacterium]|jgi:hypothetical protein|nr:DUF1801 domain-containing protein [Micromonosporaceae bacterium]
MDDAVRAYIDAIDPLHRPLFDRLQGLILDAYPGASVTLSYQIPTYRVGSRRVYLAAWRHGVSIYGWDRDRDGGFLARHPELTSGKGTIRLRVEDAARIDDDEFRHLLHAALDETA